MSYVVVIMTSLLLIVVTICKYHIRSRLSQSDWWDVGCLGQLELAYQPKKRSKTVVFHFPVFSPIQNLARHIGCDRKHTKQTQGFTRFLLVRCLRKLRCSMLFFVFLIKKPCKTYGFLCFLIFHKYRILFTIRYWRAGFWIGEKQENIENHTLYQAF